MNKSLISNGIFSHKRLTGLQKSKIWKTSMQSRFKARHLVEARWARRSRVREKSGSSFRCISSSLPASLLVYTTISSNCYNSDLFKRDFWNEKLWPRIWNKKDGVEQSDIFASFLRRNSPFHLLCGGEKHRARREFHFQIGTAESHFVEALLNKYKEKFPRTIYEATLCCQLPE